MNEELNIEQVKKISLDLLIDIRNYCEANNITYFLACGTLLGAIRHKGFIPWDDDVDIMMPRPDYNKFLNQYNGRYSILKPSDGRFYFAKVYDNNTIVLESDMDNNKNQPIGINVDIFPLDGIVNDEKIISKLYKKACFLEALLRLSNQPIFYRKNPIKAINRIIPRLIGSKRIIKLIEKNAQTYSFEDSNYVVRMRRSTNGFTGALPKAVYEKEYKPFEGELFCVPKGYDEWLKNFYGDDYMTPVEPNKQKPIHKRQYFKKYEQ